MNGDVIKVGGIAVNQHAQKSRRRTTPSQNNTDLRSVQVDQERPVASDAQHSRATNSRRAERTDDERRLLGYNEVDLDAIPIAIPGSNLVPSVMPQAVSRGGPRPMNTLGERKHEHQGSWAAKDLVNGLLNHTSSLVQRGYKTLETGLSIGHNVTSSPRRLASPTDPGAERPRKRLKVTVIPDSQEVLNIDQDSEEVDVLSLEQHGKGMLPPDRKDSHTPSVLSQGSGSTFPVRISHKGSVEFHKMEKMMRSNPGRSKPRKSKDQSSPDPLLQSPSVTPMSHLNNQQPNIIDLDQDESNASAPYKGTARPKALPCVKNMGSNGIKQRLQTEEKSPHFPQLPSINGGVSIPLQARTHDTPEDDSLRKRFIQTDGKRRSSDIGISSDELASEPSGDYASVTRLSPMKKSRHPSPSKPEVLTRGMMTAPDSTSGLAKSNIRPTLFTESGRKQGVTSQHSKSGRAAEPVGYVATSVVTGRFHYSSGNIGLVFDGQGAYCDICRDGHYLTEDWPDLKIRPEKLMKILWAPSSLKIRLEMCKTGNEDNRIDVQLRSQKIVSQLLNRLQTLSPLCNLVEKNSDSMDKIFFRRLEERPAESSTTNAFNDQRNDIELLTKRKDRRDRRLHPSRTEMMDTNGRRTGDKVIDRLVGEEDGDNPTQISQVQLRHGDESKGSFESTSKTKRSGGIREILDKLNPYKGNPHLTRSRLSTKTGPTQAKEPSLFIDDFPEHLRYSRMNDLGPQWSKPLMYPKSGKKRTTVEWQDLERLDDGQFLNDNLIAFYLRYLERKLEDGSPELAKKVYFFNTYFFTSLTNTSRGRRGINYQAVRNWTRMIDIFTYDYVVVPINESAHWYVAIICNLPALNRNPDPSGDTTTILPVEDKIGGLDGADDDRMPELTSSLSNTRSRDPPEPVEGNEKPDERDTRESFAEMNLLDDNNNSTLTVEQHEDIQGEIEAIDSNAKLVPDREAMGERKSLQMDQAEHEAHEDLFAEDEGAIEAIAVETPVRKAVGSTKKGKRKSIPPMKTLDPDQPAIIILDSLGLSHSPTVRILKDYLHEEAKDKRGGMYWDDGQLKGMTAKQIPQQDNFCDCGLFLLGYLEKFVDNPREFVVKILRREYDEKMDWPKLVPSEMRANIRGLIQGLHASQEDERSQVRRGSARNIGKDHDQTGHVPTSSPSRETIPVKPEGVGISERNMDALVTGENIERTLTPKEVLDPAARVDEPEPHAKKIKETPVYAGKSGSVEILPASNATIESPFVIVDSQPEVASQQAQSEGVLKHNVREKSFELPAEVATTPPSPACKRRIPDPYKSLSVVLSPSKRTRRG